MDRAEWYNGDKEGEGELLFEIVDVLIVSNNSSEQLSIKTNEKNFIIKKTIKKKHVS